MFEINGERPIGDVIFASCDSVYFNNFGIPLLYSANEHGNDLHIHIMNPTYEDIVMAQNLKNEMKVNFTYSYEQTPANVREYYSCNRFMVAPYFLETADRILIIDTDCLMMQKLEFPDAELGLFLRDPIPGTVGWENEGTHVAAGMVLMSKEAMNFAKDLSKQLYEHQLIWFLDQVMLWRLYNEYKEVLNFHQFTDKDMDWEFLPDTKIWTGKGPRKYDNPKYVAEQQKYRDMHVS